MPKLAFRGEKFCLLLLLCVVVVYSFTHTQKFRECEWYRTFNSVPPLQFFQDKFRDDYTKKVGRVIFLLTLDAVCRATIVAPDMQFAIIALNFVLNFFHTSVYTLKLGRVAKSPLFDQLVNFSYVTHRLCPAIVIIFS